MRTAWNFNHGANRVLKAQAIYVGDSSWRQFPEESVRANRYHKKNNNFVTNCFLAKHSRVCGRVTAEC